MMGVAFLPIDYLFTGSGSQPITFAFSYDARAPLSQLQASLDRVLESFPVLNAKILKVSDKEYEYRCDGPGLVIEQDKVQTVFSPHVWQEFITPIQSTDGEPVCRIVLSDTPKGSVLAVSMSHALVDGFSYFHFLSSWARQSRGDRFLAPNLERHDWANRWPAMAENIAAEMMLTKCGLFYDNRKRSSSQAVQKEKRLQLTDTDLRAMIQEAKAGQDKVVFENDVITAWLWKTQLAMSPELERERVTYLTCPFDFRRVYPGFAKTYFGCALAFATASLSIEELNAFTIGQVAQVVHESIKRVQEGYINESMQTLASLRLQQGAAGFEHVHLRHPQRGLIVTNLTRLPVRDLDFGFGAPTGFSTRMEFDKSAAILPAENGVEILLAM
jgi:hypothetical protein